MRCVYVCVVWRVNECRIGETRYASHQGTGERRKHDYYVIIRNKRIGRFVGVGEYDIRVCGQE